MADTSGLVINEIRVHKINEWNDFLKIINDLDVHVQSQGKSFKFSEGFIFRGQSNADWELSSKLERNLVIEAIQDKKTVVLNVKTLNGQEWYNTECNNLLERFKLYVSQIPGFIKMEDSELWAFGRHHGLLTPYLDWSYNPYVAAFFAFYDDYKKYELGSTIGGQRNAGPVVVWKLNLWEGLFINDEFEKMEVGSKMGSRVNAQEGLFTILKTTNFSDLESYLKSRKMAHCLEKIELPIQLATEALNNLSIMGLSIFKLFPDYTGAAEQANVALGYLHQAYYIDRYIQRSK